MTIDLFPESAVRDDRGELVPLFHGTQQDFDEFSSEKTVDGGFHFGTLEQARMRTFGKGKRLVQAVLDIRNPKRCRDTGGDWKRKIREAKAQGHDGIVYLNRYEGTSLASIEAAAARKIDLDAISDSEFRKAVPESRDSWIAFSPVQIAILDRDYVPTAQTTAQRRPKP